MPIPKSELNKRKRDERLAQGLKELRIWAPPEKHEAIRKAAERIINKA